MDNPVAQYIERGAKRTGYTRERYVEKNIPTSPQNVVAFPFYGDTRSTFILSSFLLKEYKRTHPDKYIVMCSWPGYSSMFPYVDEYWTLPDISTAKRLVVEAQGFANTSDLYAQLSRSLLESFEVMNYRDLEAYYSPSFTENYWNDFGKPMRYLPQVPSESTISDAFREQMQKILGNAVLVHPTTRFRTWHNGRSQYIPASREFWSHLVQRLLEEGITPVVYQNYATYDLSRDYVNACVFISPSSVADVMAAMNYTGCVLDVFGGISRLALGSRTPFVAVDERSRYIEQRDDVIDDLFPEIPKQYVFAFSTMLLSGTPANWDTSFVNGVMVRLKRFLPTLKKGYLGLNEMYGAADYDKVRERRRKRLGVNFLRRET